MEVEAMNTGDTGTSDPHYNLVSVLYHALQGAETIDMYVTDAEGAGDKELAEFFRNVKQGYTRTAEQAKQLLVGRIEHTH
jgi:hypothetical protein